MVSVKAKIATAIAKVKAVYAKLSPKVKAVLMQDQVQHVLASVPSALVLYYSFTMLPLFIAIGVSLFSIAFLVEQREGAAKAWYGMAYDDVGMRQAPFFGVQAELYGLRRVLGLGEDPDRKDTFRDVFYVGGAQVAIGALIQLFA